MTRIDRDDVLGPSPDRLRQLTLAAMAAHGRDERLEQIRAAGPDIAPEWLAFAERNRVAPVVAHALLDAFGDGFEGADEARRAHDASLRRMDVMLDELDAVAERLDAAGIRMIALKNAGIARGIFPCRGCCPMGDLDVLVDRERFREAHAIIEDAGFTLATRGTVESADLEEGLHSGGTEYRKQTGGEEVWFELQWRPVAGRWIRKDQEPEGAALIARSVAIDGTRVRLLSPVDNMIQVALHTAKHTYVRAPGLRLHTDVDRLARYQPPDWPEVAAMASRLQIETAVYFSLALAEALLGTPVPESTLAALAPPAWKRRVITRILRHVDVFEPNERKFNRPGMMVFTALLYDDAPGLVASVLDTTPDELGLRHAPRNLRRGVARVTDIVTRYQS